MKALRIRSLALLGLVLVASPAFSQYEATILRANAEVRGAYGGFQYGNMDTGSTRHAARWAGTPGSLVDLNPSGVPSTNLYAATNGQAGGIMGPHHHAAIFDEVSNTWTDIHPGNLDFSEIRGMSGNSQVGYGGVQTARALYWQGSAATMVDLTPAGAAYAWGWAASDSAQVGMTSIGDGDHWRAALWRGSAASYVDLNPSGATLSAAFAAFGDTQGGMFVNAGIQAAALWSGTPETVVSLAPPGWEESLVQGMSADYQVGFGKVSSVSNDYHALVWSGTASSYFDLHSLLPPGYSRSFATCIDPVTGEIGGYADSDAVVWRPVPEPSTVLTAVVGLGCLLRRRRRGCQCQAD